MWSFDLRRVLTGLAMLVFVGGLGACTSSAALDSSRPRVLDITAREFSYEITTPTPVAAGVVTVRMHNAGAFPHQANLARLHDGVTLAQFTQALRTNAGAALALVDFVGGPNTVDGGATTTAITRLSAGDYVILCFVAGPDHVPHVAKGMLGSFAVVGRDDDRAPHTKGTVRLYDYGLAMPAGFGHGRYAVENTGDDGHELSIVRVAPGKTADDV